MGADPKHVQHSRPNVEANRERPEMVVSMCHEGASGVGRRMVCSLSAALQRDVERSTCVSDETEPVPTVGSQSPLSAPVRVVHFAHKNIRYTESNNTLKIGQHRRLCLSM